MLDPTEESVVKEIFRAARIPWSQLEGRTQRNEKGRVTKLRFSPCLELEQCPKRIGDLSSLEEIYFFWASRRLTHLPSDSFDRLKNLRVLQIRWCQGIKEIPPLSESIEELVIEGCDDIVDFSSFRTSKRTYKRLQSLQIIQIGTQGVRSLTDALTMHDKHEMVDENKAKSEESNQTFNADTSSMSFPSLTFLSLRHNKIDEIGLAKLWPFFRRCHNLTKIDLGNNEIRSLKNIAPVMTTRFVSELKTIEMALRELNLAGNPVCSSSATAPSQRSNNQHIGENDQVDDLEGGDRESALEDDDTTESTEEFAQDALQMRPFDNENKNLLQIIIANPLLISISVCKGDCEDSSNTNNGDSGVYKHERCRCFENSALYSPSVRHALDLNRCSKGTTLIGARPAFPCHKRHHVIPKEFSLSKWALVLARTNRIFRFCPTNTRSTDVSGNDEESKLTIKSMRNRNALCQQVLEERNASVIYALLQGPALAARGNQFTRQ